MLAERSAEITKILDETARPLVERFAAGGDELAEEPGRGHRTRRPNGCAPKTPRSVNALASRTAETLSAVEGARSTLAEGVSDLIGRLAASSAQLNELIEAAAQNLGKVDERLTGSTQSFAATTEKAAQTFASSARLVDSEHHPPYRAVVRHACARWPRSPPSSTSTAGCWRALRIC